MGIYSEGTSFSLTLPKGYGTLLVNDSLARGLVHPVSGKRLSIRECCYSLLCSYVEQELLNGSVVPTLPPRSVECELLAKSEVRGNVKDKITEVLSIDKKGKLFIRD